MIQHVVLFRPRPDLASPERAALVDALLAAFREIPSIRAARVGRRMTHGRPYEQLMRSDFTYAAFLDFDDRDGLLAYLNHPSHELLAQRFFAAFEEALMYDYDVKESETEIRSLLHDQ